MITEQLRKEINQLAHDRGWWKDGIDLHKKLLLIVSEVTELMEADRKGKECNILSWNLRGLLEHTGDASFIEQFEMFVKHTKQDEMADIIIRASDLAYEMDIDVELHIKLKHRYNSIKNPDKNKKY